MSEYKIKGYVARDKNGTLTFGNEKPSWYEFIDSWLGFGEYMQIPSEWFQNLKWSDEPIEVELTIKKL